MQVRPAEDTEIEQLARLWHEAWHDAHAAIVPADLTRLRTLESFRHRIQQALPDVRVVGPPAAPVGFCIVRGAELYQLFVSAGSRGSGVAAALIDDAEARLSAAGVETAWLGCAIGNERAARFYEKHGWHRVGAVLDRLDTSIGDYLLEVWRYEKPLAPSRRNPSTEADAASTGADSPSAECESHRDSRRLTDSLPDIESPGRTPS